MDTTDTPKARRPLPTPGSSSQRPNTPILSPAPVSTTSFYAHKPPPLPSRPRNPGSNHTAYVPPPSYGSSSFTSSPGFREPELVEDVPEEDDVIPDLIPQSDSRTWNNSYDSNWGGDNPSWDNQTTTWQDDGTPSILDFEYLNSNRLDHDHLIDGRNSFEETSWWDPEERDRNKRPGPGILPPVLADDLHDPIHSLFSVNVNTSPDIPTSSSKTQSAPVPSPSSSISSVSPLEPPPTDDEVRMSIPHPNAYYCQKDNGWVILSWKASSLPPPFAESFINGVSHSLPDQSRRLRTGSCIDGGDGKSNKTHHFHKYEKAVDSHKLTPPFREDEWQKLESVKQRRRAGTIMSADLDINAIGVDGDLMDTAEPASDTGKLLDIYICCQCTFYCVASGVIPGVIPKKHIEELVRDKKSQPPLGKTWEQAVILAFETFLSAIENKLWKGEIRHIRTKTGFLTKVGWNANIKRICELLGFTPDMSDPDMLLRPPPTDVVSAIGKQNRRKLLRARVEISSWLTEFKRQNAPHLKDCKERKLYVQVESAREMYQNAIGAHPDQIARGELDVNVLKDIRTFEAAWRGLGLTPTTFSTDFLIFAYLAQCRCDPAGTPKYFTYLTELVKCLSEYGTCSSPLQELVAMEQSRDRFTQDDLRTAANKLGFGSNNVLGVDYDDEIPDEFVENAWKASVKRSWRDATRGAEIHRQVNEAFRILAESRGSVKLRRSWEAGKNKYMNPDQAYNTLEIPKDVDDYMLITVYNMRLEETPMQLDKMREAMMVIAEVRDSQRLRHFLSSGQDPGEIVAPTRPDLPRGLNQLGNTCYLNSLLQYFYTIKDLREAVVPMLKLNMKEIDDENLTDEDLKRHRVGGRLVTRREIVRSRRFINQLADLFFHLEYCEAAAVTPTIELAKLALITSRDEDEDEVDKGGTDSSNDTDATLVEDGPSRTTLSHTADASLISSSSVLGKRPRDLDHHSSDMDVDTPLSNSPKENDDFVLIADKNRSQSSSELSSSLVDVETSSSGLIKDRNVKLVDAPVPQKLAPPRKRADDSTMMFGKQHDVAECMDNCMFQIETALLKFDQMSDSSDKTSVVKSLFYGKIRQRLTGQDAHHSRSSIHEKEDLFSHLPVNVTNDGVDIYDGLSGYFDDMVEFEGRKVRMEVTLVDLPPVLQIQLQRVQFNRETLQPYKSQAYVKFGENLYVDRFLDTADLSKKTAAKGIQAELNACRERLRLLLEGKETSFASTIERMRKFLSGLHRILATGIEEEVLRQLDEEQARILSETDRLRNRIDLLKNELETIWNDCTEAAYELTSVFIHRGSSASWGHYFFYSRNLPGSPDSWFKYNDSDVTVVTKEEVLADTTGSTANPYLLVFAKKGSDVVDTVKRVALDPV